MSKNKISTKKGTQEIKTDPYKESSFCLLSPKEPLPECEEQEEKWKGLEDSLYAPQHISSVLSEKKVIIDQPDFKLVTDNKYPYNCIAKLDIRFGAQTVVGTGFFISPRCVVTAGHCVYNCDSKCWASAINVLPGVGLTGNEHPLKIAAAKVYSIEGWTINHDNNYDYGAIILSDNKSFDVKKYLKLKNNIDINVPIELAGYPAIPILSGKQWRVNGKIERSDERRLYYKMDTTPGSSGSPLFYCNKNGEYYVVGLHHYGYTNPTPLNSAIRLTEEVIGNYNRWEND